jgi:hypothetical protein
LGLLNPSLFARIITVNLQAKCFRKRNFVFFADPGPVFLYIPDPGSKIQPQQQKRGRGELIVLLVAATIITKFKNILFLNRPQDSHWGQKESQAQQNPPEAGRLAQRAREGTGAGEYGGESSGKRFHQAGKKA